MPGRPVRPGPGFMVRRAAELGFCPVSAQLFHSAVGSLSSAPHGFMAAVALWMKTECVRNKTTFRGASKHHEPALPRSRFHTDVTLVNGKKTTFQKRSTTYYTSGAHEETHQHWVVTKTCVHVWKLLGV